jgi:hypothetical protein
MQEEHERPGFLLKHLKELTQPTLYAIEGGGQGNGIPAGVLRLVRVEPKDE